MGVVPVKELARSFSDDPRSLLKIDRRPSPRAVTLADGTELAPGDPLVTTHLWNEHLPLRADAGLATGLELLRDGRSSLRELARHVAADPELAGARAIYGEMGFVADEQMDQARRIVGELGFELVPGERPGWNPLRDAFWRNVVSWWYLKRFNPARLRRLEFGRMRRCEMWMSLDTLFARYG
jgi:hypothetical protein